MNRNILITGGTTGIGAALAHLYKQGNTVFVTGSKPEGQIDPALIPKHYIAANQIEPRTVADAILTALAAAGVDQLDLVILNAGIGYWRTPANETLDEVRSTIDVNLAANIALAHSLCLSLEKAKGTLVLIGSTSHKGQAKLATYAASKAALDGFARALRSEWQGRINVQIIHPGPTITPMHEKAGLDIGKMGALFASPQTAAKMIAAAIHANRLRTTLNFTRRILFAATSWAHR